MKLLARQFAVQLSVIGLLGVPTVVRAVELVNPKKPINENIKALYEDVAIPLMFWVVLLMVIVSGYLFVTSMGNAERVKLSKEVLGSTLVGAILLLLIPLILQALGQQK